MFVKDYKQQNKKAAHTMEKTLSNHVFHKGFMFRIYEALELNKNNNNKNFPRSLFKNIYTIDSYMTYTNTMQCWLIIQAMVF
jgi:hypothetical protein